jgi:O-antigen/teichoic acid export membrane protein
MFRIKNIIRNEIANRFVKVLSIDVLVKGASFLLLPVYLHLMTQDEVGIFNYLYAFIQTISVVFNFGLYTSQSKLYHEYTGINRKQLLFLMNMILLSLLIIILVPTYSLGLDFKFIAFLFEYPIPYERYRWSLLLALLTSVASNMLFNFFLTSENIKRVQLYNLLRLLISNGAVISILFFSKGDKVLTRLTTYYSCEAFVWSIFSIGYIRQFSPTFSYKLTKHILSYSIPVFLLAIISTIQGFSDKFFIQQKTDMSVMAVYTTGVTVASVCSLVITSFQNIWLPIFLKEKNIKTNFQRTQRMAKIVAISFSCIALLMIVGVKLALMFHIIPTTYNDVLIILPFLFIAQIISSVNALYGNYFVYFGRMRLGVLTGGSMYIISFFLNFFLIPLYGVTGAIIALILGNSILLITVFIIVKGLYNNYASRQL